MRQYWKGSIWELLLCTVMSGAMLLTFSQGFYIPDEVADSVPMAFGVSFAVLFVCYLLGYNYKTRIVLVFAALAAAAGLFALMRSRGIDIVDEPASDTAVYIYYFAALIIPFMAYLLAQGRIGVCVLFVLGIVLIGMIDYLNYEARAWCCVVFVLAGLALFCIRQYKASAKKGTAYSPQFGKFTGSALCVGVVSLLLAGGVFLAVVRPLQPPTAQLEFITRFLNWDVLERLGATDNYLVLNEMLKAENDNLGDMQTDKQKQQEDSEGEDADGTENLDVNEGKSEEEAYGEKNGAEMGPAVMFERISYSIGLARILKTVFLIVAVVIVCVVWLMAYLRKRFWKKVEAMDACGRAVFLGRYYIRRFGRLGCKKAPCLTEREYAASQGPRVDLYTDGTLSLRELMDIYSGARYGGCAPPPEQDAQMIAFYPAFKKNYRKQRGVFRYMVNFFKF